MMKAAILQARGESGLVISDAPEPERRADESIMRVHASSLNRVDLYMRDSGLGITHDLPLILGVDGVGEIVDPAPGSQFRSGDRVALFSTLFCGQCRYCLDGDQPLCLRARIAGEHRDGSFAEFISMPSKCFIPLPESISFEAAGVLPAAYVTAYRMLFGKRPIAPGETVLVVGAGGGVGVACVQLAVLAGATVYVTTSIQEKLDQAASLGAQAGINYRSENVPETILALTKGQGVDMVIDSVGQATWSDSLRCVRRGGCIVTCGATTGGNPPADIQRLFIRQLEIYGSTGGNIREFRNLLAMVEQGRLNPVIDSRFELASLNEGFTRLAAGEQFGKIAIQIP
ncbi:zinc-binding dehydrogenase [Hyphomonas chukchiensis]|nr:zinc-binding dehydrogenase [Hyphomonas chukchiensis]